ncbi:MAG: DNA/RNA nuclease SfsA [Prochlorotrichaceae cyanobacterium]|jgi:sugar fermentation stimulation protein A
MFFQYPPLQQGTLLRRYKRFMADIELDSGERITAHCPNTGPMTGVCTPGYRVAVSLSHNPKRKYAYTWELIEVLDPVPTWVGVNTSLPNRLVKLALQQQLIPEVEGYDQIETEVPYGKEKSRIDFRLISPQNDRGDLYLEVKNTTWAQGSIALFPDTVTTRGQKHLRELMALLPENRSVLLYFINRGDCSTFSPGDSADPVYGQLLRTAIEKGLEVLPCRFQIAPEGVSYLGLADLQV